VRVPPDTDPETLRHLLVQAKEQLRRQQASLRRALGEQPRQRRSRAACERLLAEPVFVHAACVCAYMPLRFELDVRPVIEAAWAQGKRVALTRVRPEDNVLHVHGYEPGAALVESAFAVHEPLAAAPAVDPEDVDLVLVPGLAFDERGYRLGFGKGFYDRLLPQLSRAARVGVGFDFQLLAEVPHEDHDVPLSHFVSDARSLTCSG